VTVRAITDQTFRLKHVENKTFEDLRLERCKFDNAYAKKCVFRRVEVIEARTWACHIQDSVLEDCLIDGIRMTVDAGSGGKHTPLFLGGNVAKHVTLRGSIGSFIWNPPNGWHPTWDIRALERVKEFYRDVDWALDIREARFTTVPTFRFGPPGHLVRRDLATQAVVTRATASGRPWRDKGVDIGVWDLVISRLLEKPWPDEIVLVPAYGKKGERDRAGIERLRDLGVAD
jgi:hypothetical protein